MEPLKYPPFYDRYDFESYHAWQFLSDLDRIYIYQHVQKKIKKKLLKRRIARELRRRLFSERDDKIKVEGALAV